MNAPELFAATKVLRKEGRIAECLDLIRHSLRRGELGAEDIEKAGRFVRKEILAGTAGAKPLRILILGQCTTSWLTTTLTAVALRHNVQAHVTEGAYDNVVQELMSIDPESRPDVIVLLPWNLRLINGQGPTADRAADELDFWTRAWGIIADRLGSRIVQVGYDWVTAGPMGYGMGGRPNQLVEAVRAANAALQSALPADAYFVDLEQVSGTFGRASFYDMRRYHWTKQPFSEAGIVRLAEHIWAGTRSLTTGPKKVLVLDLDNTLWGGVVGETGPLGVTLGESPDGEAYLAFQKYVKGLANRGIVLALASKNNLADGLEPFEKNPEMVLKLDDLGAYEINWEPKGTTIARLAETLSLGLDSFVFFDDNPAEREQVRQAIPDVEVVDVPEDPAEYVRALHEGLWFETTRLTKDDQQRTEQYAVERKRRELQQTHGSMEDYLKSLNMTAEVRAIDDADLQRVTQLLSKTNQFNLTTRRHTREDVLELLGKPDSIGLTIRVQDRFGDYGLVAVMIAVPTNEFPSKTLQIDTWLMSCRVINRTVEQFSMATVLERCKDLGYVKVLGEYIPTKKNALVAELYDKLGFRRLEGGNGESIRYIADVENLPQIVHYIESK
jgi:FkbH-like protein